MSTLRTLLGPFQRFVGALQGSRSVYRQAAAHERELRSLIGGDYQRGSPVLHLRCGRCGARLGTVESGDGGLYTLRNGRRYPGVPYAYRCPVHDGLRLEKATLVAGIRIARKKGKPVTVKL